MIEDITLPGANLNFFLDIDALFETANASYLDCILHWCERNKVEIELITPLLTSNNISIARLRCDAQDLHFLKREIRRPL